MRHLNRREFIQLTATAIGGVYLTGCNDSGRGGGIPNGYRFHRVTSRGDTVGDFEKSLRIDSFRGTVHISDNGIITFDAFDQNNRLGIFQVGINLDGRRPTVEWGRTALLTGETLADGRVVSNFKAMDVNRAGSIAVDIVPTTPKGEKLTHVGSGLYLDNESRGFEPIFKYKQNFLDQSVYSTGILGDIDLHENNEILVVSSYNSSDPEILPAQGLFHLPGACVESAAMLLSSGDFIPSPDHFMGAIGLVDLHDNGNFMVQGHALPLTASQANRSASNSQGSPILLSANVNSAEYILHGASPEVGAGKVVGQTFYGPRLAPSGAQYSVTWDSDTEIMKLYKGDQLVIGTGDASPSGGEVLMFSTGSVGSDDAFYYTITSVNPNSQDLVVYNGVNHTILLSKGDVLTEGGAPVETIYFGTTTKHIDEQNRMVLFCSFTDGSSSLVVGLPV